MATPAQSGAPSLDPPPVSVEVSYLPARVVARLDQWIKGLISSNGGFGEVTIEVNDGKVKRIRPTESWLADKL